jgi:hypothetical protein
MPNRVDNPVAGARPGTERAEQSQQATQADAPPDTATTDRVEISNAARQQAQAPATERGAAQGAPSAQAEQLGEVQRAQPESQQPGNLVDVTGG